MPLQTHKAFGTFVHMCSKQAQQVESNMLPTNELVSDTFASRNKAHTSNGKADAKHTSQGVLQHRAGIALNVLAATQTLRH